MNAEVKDLLQHIVPFILGFAIMSVGLLVLTHLKRVTTKLKLWVFIGNVMLITASLIASGYNKTPNFQSFLCGIIAGALVSSAVLLNLRDPLAAQKPTESQ